MSRICQITGKRQMTGNNRSHAMNATKRKFLPNLHYHKFWIESKQSFIRLRISTKAMRIIDKNGIESVLNQLKKTKKNRKKHG